MIKSASEILFHPSSLGKIMTNPKKGETGLPKGCITHLIDAFVTANYERRTEFSNKYIKKGLGEENASITILSKLNKKFYKKNEVRLTNAYLTGEIDVFDGPDDDINHAEENLDLKSSWDAFTFFRVKYGKTELDSDYYWQGVGYLALNGAKKHTVAYILTNTPYHLVEAELWKESYKWPERTFPAWVELQIIANLVYDRKTFDEYVQIRGCFPGDDIESQAVYHGFVEIPLEFRKHEVTFMRDDAEILRVYNRIKECRKWLQENIIDKP